MLLKTAAVAGILAALTAGQLELVDQAFGALGVVQGQQAAAVAQIEAVRAGRPIPAVQAPQHQSALMQQAADALSKTQGDHRAALAQLSPGAAKKGTRKP